MFCKRLPKCGWLPWAILISAWLGCDALRVGREAIELGDAVTEVAREVRRELSRYDIRDAQVFWGGELIPGVDAATFTASTTEYGNPLPWGADRFVATLRGAVIPGSDGQSFRAFSRDWAADKNQVYFAGVNFTRWEIKTCEVNVKRFPKENVSVLMDVNAEYFRLIKDTGSVRSWYCDHENVFYGLQRVNHADPATFRSMRNESLPLWRDKRYLYRFNKRLESVVDGKPHAAMADEFCRIEDSNYFTDGVAVWYGGNLWESLDEVVASAAAPIRNEYLSDGQSLWRQSRKVGRIPNTRHGK
ncbi:MAG: DKNYY domain-containing protein [Planctomycetota bacterium]